MPPLSTGHAGTGTASTPPSGQGLGCKQLLRGFLFLLIMLAVFRLATTKIMTRKRRTVQLQSQSPYFYLKEEEDINTLPRQARSPTQDLRPYRLSQSRDLPPPNLTFKTIYPWTAPPQPLAGPYDPRIYPLPNVRRHSHDPTSAYVRNHITTSLSYVRRVSTDATPGPASRKLLRGAVMESTRGWRRNQWVVEGE
jgi:hypothetical protein